MKFSDQDWAVRRLCKLLYGFEYIFDALICDHIRIEVTRPPNAMPQITLHPRRWHPSYFLGWVRCVIFGDVCGSAYYGRPK